MRLYSFTKPMALLIALVFLALTNASAQTSDQTTLNVVLNPLLSIKVNDASVTLTLETESDYVNGVSEQKAAHLTVSSLLGYTINLKSDNTTLAGTTTPANSLKAKVIDVSLPATSTNSTLGGTTQVITELSGADQPLIENATPTLQKKIDVKYQILNTMSNSAEILGKPADTYHSTITYSISSL